MDDEKPILVQLPRLPSQLWCADWYGYCARCMIWRCSSRAEEFGQPRRPPKHNLDYLCEGDVGDEGWGVDL